VIAAALVFLATQPPGPGLDPDAMAYTGAATSLVQRGTLRVPTGQWDRADSTSSLSLWPPGYPAALAVPMELGLTPIQSGRWIDVVSAGITALVVGLLVASAAGSGAGLVAVLVIFATQAVFDVHLSVLSEPLFIALMLLTLAAMVRARDQLWLLAILATACVMVRYAGGAAPAAVVCWTLLDSRYAFRRRVRRAVGVAILPALALVIWFVRTARAPDRHATPELAMYGAWGDAIAQARDTVASWLAPVLDPGTPRRIVAAVVAIAVIAFIVMAAHDTMSGARGATRTGARRSSRERARFGAARPELLAPLIAAASLLGAWYLVVVLASRAFVGGGIPLDWRILAPVIVLVEVMAVASIGYWWRAYHRPLHILIGVLGAAWIIAAGVVTFNDAQWAATEGSDFASTEWRTSPLVAWIRAHGNGHPLYSNWPAALYFHAHRIARELPDSTDTPFLREFGDSIASQHAYVVAFDAPSPDFIPTDSLAKLFGWERVTRVADGTVWAAHVAAPADSIAAPPAGTPAAPPANPPAATPAGGASRPR